MIEAVLALTLAEKVILFLIGVLALLGAAFLVAFARRCFLSWKEEEREEEGSKPLFLKRGGLIWPDLPGGQNFTDFDGIAKRLRITKEEEAEFDNIIFQELRSMANRAIPPGPKALPRLLEFTIERRIKELRATK